MTPDTYTIEKVKMKVLNKKLRKKGEKYCLTNKEIFEVTALIKKVEEFYGVPMDIEWAIQDNKLYLLQARPITAYFPLFPEYLTKP
jgi:pyruvate,water dikinase